MHKSSIGIQEDEVRKRLQGKQTKTLMGDIDFLKTLVEQKSKKGFLREKYEERIMVISVCAVNFGNGV